MKYIVLKQNFNGIIREISIIFPNELVHSEVARLFQEHYPEFIGRSEVISAGDINVGDVECAGKSTSLKIKSREKNDEDLINTVDYFHGIVEE
jgi:hypothetical protein